MRPHPAATHIHYSKAPFTLIRFQKYPFSSRRKRSKILKQNTSTLALLYRFHLSTVKRSKTRKATGTWDCACFDLDWNRWHVTLFTSLFSKVSVFSLSTLEIKRSVFKTMRFQSSPPLKPFSKVSVFIGVFGRFSVDDRQKRIKKYTFSNENALVWMGPKFGKTTAN